MGFTVCDAAYELSNTRNILNTIFQHRENISVCTVFVSDLSPRAADLVRHASKQISSDTGCASVRLPHSICVGSPQSHKCYMRNWHGMTPVQNNRLQDDVTIILSIRHLGRPICNIFSQIKRLNNTTFTNIDYY